MCPTVPSPAARELEPNCKNCEPASAPPVPARRLPLHGAVHALGGPRSRSGREGAQKPVLDIRRAPVTFQMSKVPDSSYYTTLHRKLSWGGQPNYSP